MQWTDNIPFCVGLTGGIGSGKSTVAAVFQRLGIPVYIADDEAKKLIDSDMFIRKEIIRHFGEKAYTPDGLNRSYIAEKVFSNKKKLALLNSITHPAVKEHFKKWLAKQNALFTIKEAAILFEAGTYRDCDFIISVVAPQSLRIERVQKRSGLSRSEIESRMAQQWTDARRIQLSDYIVLNDGQHSILTQILHIYEDIIRRANQRSRPIHHKK